MPYKQKMPVSLQKLSVYLIIFCHSHNMLLSEAVRLLVWFTVRLLGGNHWMYQPDLKINRGLHTIGRRDAVLKLSAHQTRTLSTLPHHWVAVNWKHLEGKKSTFSHKAHRIRFYWLHYLLSSRYTHSSVFADLAVFTVSCNQYWCLLLSSCLMACLCLVPFCSIHCASKK